MLVSQTAPCGTELPKIIERKGALDGFLLFEIVAFITLSEPKISREKIRV